jgi:hypothetical protein
MASPVFYGGVYFRGARLVELPLLLNASTVAQRFIRRSCEEAVTLLHYLGCGMFCAHAWVCAPLFRARID